MENSWEVLIFSFFKYLINVIGLKENVGIRVHMSLFIWYIRDILPLFSFCKISLWSIILGESPVFNQWLLLELQQDIHEILASPQMKEILLDLLDTNSSYCLFIRGQLKNIHNIGKIQIQQHYKHFELRRENYIFSY